MYGVKSEFWNGVFLALFTFDMGSLCLVHSESVFIEKLYKVVLAFLGRSLCVMQLLCILLPLFESSASKRVNKFKREREREREKKISHTHTITSNAADSQRFAEPRLVSMCINTRRIFFSLCRPLLFRHYRTHTISKYMYNFYIYKISGLSCEK